MAEQQAENKLVLLKGDRICGTTLSALLETLTGEPLTREEIQEVDERLQLARVRLAAAGTPPATESPG
jgi:hypothetical protein